MNTQIILSTVVQKKLGIPIINQAHWTLILTNIVNESCAWHRQACKETIFMLNSKVTFILQLTITHNLSNMLLHILHPHFLQ